MANGIKLYGEGAYDAALAEFNAAYGKKPRAGPLINQALCYKKLGRYADALVVIERALKDHSATLDAANRAAAEKESEELRALLAWVTVAVSPPEATLSIDGHAPPAAIDGLLPLRPGPNVIAAEADGFEPASRTVQLVSGRGNPAVNLVLVPRAGELDVRAKKPHAWIEVDGVPLAQGAFTGKLPPGVHAVRVYDQERASHLAVIVVAGKRAEVTEKEDGTLVSANAAPGTKPRPPVVLKRPATTELGLYGYASAGFLGAALEVDNFVRADEQGGYAIGAGGGLRVAPWGAFEVFGQYSDVRINGRYTDRVEGKDDVVSDTKFVFRSGRLGGGLRVMFGDPSVHFLGLGAGGAVIESVSVVPDQDALRLAKDEVGVGLFAELDAGIELELDRVLLALVVQATFQSSKHLSVDAGNAFHEKPVAFFGPKLQVGYALW